VTTKAQRAVLGVLDGAATFLSAQDIHARLRAQGSTVGLTSVYRATQALADDGSVDVLRTAGGESTFRRSDTPSHHHHLVCRRCGATVEVEAPGLERWLAAIARTYHYDVESHTLEVVGVCPRCTTEESAKPPA
jgi:Fur family transcriptional regulator, ferric uptake regulator